MALMMMPRLKLVMAPKPSAVAASGLQNEHSSSSSVINEQWHHLHIAARRRMMMIVPLLFFGSIAKSYQDCSD